MGGVRDQGVRQVSQPMGQIPCGNHAPRADPQVHQSMIHCLFQGLRKPGAVHFVKERLRVAPTEHDHVVLHELLGVQKPELCWNLPKIAGNALDHLLMEAKEQQQRRQQRQQTASQLHTHVPSLGGGQCHGQGMLRNILQIGHGLFHHVPSL